MPAESLYSSELFYRSRRYAQANFDSWLILSAKHGLIRPDQIVAPYECKLDSLSQGERGRLAKRVLEQTAVLFSESAQVTSICGEDYDDLLEEAGVKFRRESKFALPIGKKA
jgi:hypothetical protein